MRSWLGKNTVFVFGAGATRACGGPLTADILPNAYGSKTRPRMQLDGSLKSWRSVWSGISTSQPIRHRESVRTIRRCRWF